ncbi:DUF29 domain-containing protein [Azospirillum sp. TSO35-2]|uniref:DUF29 domain-containing protein n=1 Tax=Azospirillum sp. TSO35-2 TaxID=716796 RepID=UPI000D60D97A|nr:DUF29 domain-containing protein [Azospirillum sp. TSO35-2]PWC32360.1 hypothetical protein TSO352_16795 [Azospirillum sp. TSO35-2]
MDRSSAAYDEDFCAWTQNQAAELRHAGAERNNAPVDWENVAEEIACLGRSQRSEIDSRLGVLLVDLLKWLCCPDLRERCERGWRLTVREQREKLLREINDSPSLRPYIAEAFADVYADARLRAAVEADASDGQFPVEPPFTLDQALDPAYPAELFPPEWRV